MKKIIINLVRKFVYLVRVQILEEVCEERAGGCQNRSVSSNKPCSDVKLDIAKWKAEIVNKNYSFNLVYVLNCSVLLFCFLSVLMRKESTNPKATSEISYLKYLSREIIWQICVTKVKQKLFLSKFSIGNLLALAPEVFDMSGKVFQRISLANLDGQVVVGDDKTFRRHVWLLRQNGSRVSLSHFGEIRVHKMPKSAFRLMSFSVKLFSVLFTTN